MGNPKGVERDFDELERRGLKAARLFDRGLHQGEVARRLGVHRQSVSRWHQAWKKQGTKALCKAARAGRKPRLQPGQLEELSQGLKEGPAALGYGTALWTHLAGGRSDRATNRAEVSSGARVADSAFPRLELPATGGAGHPARRAGDPMLEARAVAGD